MLLSYTIHLQVMMQIADYWIGTFSNRFTFINQIINLAMTSFTANDKYFTRAVLKYAGPSWSGLDRRKIGVTYLYSTVSMEILPVAYLSLCSIVSIMPSLCSSHPIHSIYAL